MAAESFNLQLLALVSMFILVLASSTDFNFPAVFNFGDSNSDTGNLMAGLGFSLELPNGQTYFKAPSRRFCDGRLIVDFLRKGTMNHLRLVTNIVKGKLNTVAETIMAQGKICPLLLQTFTLLFACSMTATSIELNFPCVFNFGDSNSDTGNLIAAGIESLNPPNGQGYFGSPSGRYCDGRLIVDFLMDAMDLPFLNAYLDSIGAPIFRKGCNFAAAASTTLPATANSVSPFSFRVQVDQFLHFKARVLELLAKGKKFDKYLPLEDYFVKGLYMFDIGQNDLAGAFYSKSFDQVVASIPIILVEFETGVKTLYDQGARNFWIHNTGPLGCITQNVAKFGTDPSKLDEIGCVSNHNQAAKLFNLQLHALATKLRGQYPDANITYVDIFSIKSNLVANYARYGFEQPLMACCGYGGPPLNYDSRISCGQTKIINGTLITVKACDDSTEYINWDGIHYTEAANEFVSSQILTGRYSDPPFADKMPSLLKLKF